VISGGEALAMFGTVAGAGVGAAPGVGTITTVLAIDATTVLAACLRMVSHTAMYYGYDPNEPAETAYVLSVINLGSAVTASGKYAAYAELPRVTQILVRGGTWASLTEHLLPRIMQRFAAAFSVRLTKVKLGQLVPVAGIAAGAGLNYWMIDQVADAAYWTYRERFLNEKIGVSEPLVPSDLENAAEEPPEGDLGVVAIVEGVLATARNEPAAPPPAPDLELDS